MFGLGMSEIMLILVLALVVIGPKKLPEVAKALGKGYGEFKRAMTDFKDAVNVEFEEQKKDEKKADISDVYDEKWKDDINEPEEVQETELADDDMRYVDAETEDVTENNEKKDTPTP